MLNSRIVKIGAVGAACAAVGAGAGILGSAGASSGAVTPSASSNAGIHHPRGAHSIRGLGLRGLRRAVSVDAFVPTKGGQFVEVTLSRGIVQSVSGHQLVLNEGTPRATYKTVTLTIPSDAVVRDNGQVTQLSGLKAGQMAVVFQGPKRTLVRAHDVRR